MYANPDATIGEVSQAAATWSCDIGLYERAFRGGAELLWRDAERAPQGRSVWVWAGIDLIAETLEARARLEAYDAAMLSRRLVIGGTFTYLAQRFRLLYDATVPIGAEGDEGVVHVASFMAVL